MKIKNQLYWWNIRRSIVNSSSNFLSKLNIGRNDFIEIESKPITKIFLSNTTEGYGFLSNTQDLYNTINKDCINVIVDGFLHSKDVFELPEEQVFYNPKLNFWWVWNVIWNKQNKACSEFEKFHSNDINKLQNQSREREMKFISLNRNFKTGRDIFVENVSQELIDENWITGHFSNRKNLKNDSLVNNDFKHFYNIIFQHINNKGYIQPFFESPGLNDAITDKMLMITEKSCIPFLLGNIAVPMNLYYVSEYEKLGFKFVKDINGIQINETIDWDINSDIELPKKWLLEQTNRLNLINKNNTLQDIKKVYDDNLDIIKHNQNLVVELMTNEDVLDELKQWIKNENNKKD